jgi:predicted DNA-binding transcriptional regulator AlpA
MGDAPLLTPVDIALAGLCEAIRAELIPELRRELWEEMRREMEEDGGGDRLIQTKAVLEMLTVSSSGFERLRNDPEEAFPTPTYRVDNKPRWVLSEVRTWMLDKENRNGRRRNSRDADRRHRSRARRA